MSGDWRNAGWVTEQGLLDSPFPAPDPAAFKAPSGEEILASIRNLMAPRFTAVVPPHLVEQAEDMVRGQWPTVRVVGSEFLPPDTALVIDEEALKFKPPPPTTWEEAARRVVARGAAVKLDLGDDALH